MNINMTDDERVLFILGHQQLANAYAKGKTLDHCPVCEAHPCSGCSYKKVVGIACTDLSRMQGSPISQRSIMAYGTEEHQKFRVRFHRAMVKSLKKDDPSYAQKVIDELKK